MGVKGRRVAVVEELSKTVISFQKGITSMVFIFTHAIVQLQLAPKTVA
jgi:hypothetical protein